MNLRNLRNLWTALVRGGKPRGLRKEPAPQVGKSLLARDLDQARTLAASPEQVDAWFESVTVEDGAAGRGNSQRADQAAGSIIEA